MTAASSAGIAISTKMARQPTAPIRMPTSGSAIARATANEVDSGEGAFVGFEMIAKQLDYRAVA